ncbi:hypothetical protein HYDPIDRAFT_76636, partial [Hydnomerulius pinastri MD-312]
HDPAGIVAVPAGSLTMECPQCPHPGKNLPDDWQMVDNSMKFLYALYLSMDTNF